MLFKAGVLDATPDVRSVPLGAKRRRGRPKRLPNCLAMSPVRAESIPNEEITEELIVEEIVRNESEEEVIEEEVDVERSQRKRKPQGFLNSKPPKKKARLPASTVSSSSSTSASAASSSKNKARLPASAASASAASSSSSNASFTKPVPKNCKKSKKACTHEIVFEKHYDKKEWKVYAERVRSAKAITPIDPDYIA